MEIFVEKAVVGQTKNNKAKTGLLADGKWYNIFEAHPEYEQKKVELKEGKFPGWYSARLIEDQPPEPPEPGNGKLEWKEYDQLARVAHKLANEIEPDVLGDQGIIVDRSQARMAFTNSALIALSNGKLWLDDDIPF